MRLPFHAVAFPVQFCTGTCCLLGLRQGGVGVLSFWGFAYLFLWGSGGCSMSGWVLVVVFFFLFCVLELSEYCLPIPLVQE